MHVVEKGTQHKTTIVLLSGLATAAPSHDFMPLMDALSKQYHIAPIVGLDSSVPQQTRSAAQLPKWVYDALRELGIVRLAT